MANDVYNNKSGSSLQDAYARLNEAIKQRNASLNGQQYDTTNGVALNTTPVGVNGQQQAQAQGSDANWAWRTIGTIDEALRNVGRGFLKLGEGVVDAHLAIGGIFDKEWAENVIKYDAVNAIMEWEAENASLNALYKQKTGNNLYDESWLNDANDKVQNIVQGVEQGIGNALGFMALSQVPYAGIGLTWSGSSGMVLEEQFNDPNYNGNFYGAWGGAFLQGGVETGLEYLLGWSPKKTGVSAKTFKTILKDLGKDFAEEGLEEVASDLINPLFEGMYTDKTLAESYDDVTIESLGETFLVGGLTGALMSGAGEVSSAIYLSPEGQKIAYEINENQEYYKQAYENFKNNPNEQEAYENFIKVRDEVATNLKSLGERVGKLAYKYQNRLGTTATINGQKVQLPMTQEVLNEQADITSKANPVVMAVQETIDLMNNSNIKGLDNMKVEFVTEGSEAYKKAFKTDVKGINGAYDKNTNTFYLNTNSAKAFKFVTGHEITHLMEENNAYEDVYKEILDSLEKSGEYDKLYKKTSKLYKEQIKGMTEEQAREYINQEIVADYFGENFKNFSEIQKLFTKQSTWEKFKDLIKSVRKSNRSSKAKDYYQRFLKEASNTKIEEKEQPTKAVAYSKSNYDVEIELENPNRDSYIKAKKEFGTTYRINLAGWLNVDGSMLDFSDGQGYRVQDHREIQNIYKDNEWTDALIQYLAEGNIRLQSYGFELWRKPTQQQIEVLKRHIKNNYGEVVVDIDYNKNGDTKTFEYERGTPANKIIEDINNYFDNGIEPIIDKADNFKYSKSIDSEGNNLSEQQARFFKDSKVVDENGNLLVVYHGTPNDFTVFDHNKIGKSSGHSYGYGFYFIADKEIANSYGESKEYYLNIKKPISNSKKTLGYQQIKKLLRSLDPKGTDGLLSDFGDVNHYGYERVLVDATNLLWENNDNDLDIISELSYLYGGVGGAREFNEILLNTLGIDGVITKYNNTDQNVFVAFNSNQIKLTSNKTPTDNFDIRYSIGGGLMHQPKQKLVANVTKDVMFDVVEGQAVLDAMQNKLSNEKITFGEGKRKVLDDINKILNLETVGTDEFDKQVEELALSIVKSMRINNYTLKGYLSTQDTNITEQEVIDLFVPIITEEINNLAKSGGTPTIKAIYDERAKVLKEVIASQKQKNIDNIKAMKDIEKQYIASLKQKYNLFIDELIGKIKILNNRVKEFKKLEPNSRKAVLKLQRQIFAFKEMAKHKYKDGSLEKLALETIGELSRLRFTGTSNLSSDARVIVKDLHDRFFNSEYVKPFFSSIKNFNQELLDQEFAYIEEKLNEYENAKTRNGKPIKKTPAIDSMNPIKETDYNGDKYDLLVGKTEAEIVNDILNLTRRLINASNGKLVEWDGGELVDAKDIASKEVELQEKQGERKQTKQFFAKMNDGLLSLIDTKAFMVIMAHNQQDSVMMKILERLQNAQNDTYRIQQEMLGGLREFFKDKDNKKLGKKLQNKKYKVKFGGVEITLGQAISLYMAMQTDNAPSHLIGDGVTFYDENKHKQYIDGEFFLSFLTEEDLKAIDDLYYDKDGNQIKTLSKEKKEIRNKYYIESIKRARNALKALIGNDFDGMIKILEKGYKYSGQEYVKAEERMTGMSYGTKDYYYPTQSDPYNHFISATDESGGQQFIHNFANPNFTKATIKGAGNSLLINDVLHTYYNFVNKISIYCGITVEAKNIDRVLNAKVKTSQANKEISLYEYMDNKVYVNFKKYYTELIRAMQGIRQSENDWFSNALRKLRGLSAKTALGANIKTIITQFTSYIRGGLFLSDSSLRKGLLSSKKRKEDGLYTFEEAMANSPYIANRYLDSNVLKIESIGALENLDDITNKLMQPIEWADKVTLAKLWYACQYETIKNGYVDSNGRPDLNKALELFEKLTQETQAQYDVLGNGSLSRTNNEIAKSFLMYTSESRKLLSRIVESIYMVAVTDKNTPEHKSAVKYLGKVSATTFLGATLVTMIASFLKFLKGDYDDKEEEQIIMDILLGEFGANIVGMIPFLKQLYDFFVQGYDIQLGGYNQVLDLLDTLKNDIPTMFSLEATDGQRRSAMLQTFTSICHLFGIPVRNLFNDTLYPLGAVDKLFDTNMVMKMKNFYYNTTNSSLNTYLKTYAKRGNEEQVAGTIQMKFKNYISGDIDDVSAKELARLYMNGSLETFPTQLSSSVYVDGVEYTLNKAQKSHAKEIYAIANELLLEMIKSSVYATLSDEEKAYAISKLYGTYYELIKQMVVSDYKGTKLSQVANYVDVTKYASILAKIGGMKATTKQTRKVVVQNYINKQRMTSNEKYLLYYLAGYSLDDEKKKLVQNYLKTKGMSYRQAKEFVQPAQNNEKEDK